MKTETNGNQPTTMPRHVRKLFDAAARVAMPSPRDCPEALARYLSELEGAVLAFAAQEPQAATHQKERV